MPNKFKSAFRHTLRSNAPAPVDLFFALFVAAILGGKYNIVVLPDGEESRINVELPNYDVAPEVEIEEGTVSLTEGVPEKKRLGLEKYAKSIYPASILTDKSVSLLKEFYAFADSKTEMLRRDEKAKIVDSLKRASPAMISLALAQIQKDAVALNNPSMIDLDPIFAKGEASVLKAFRDHEACDDELRSYFDRLIEMHSALETDEFEGEPITCGCCAPNHELKPRNH